MCFLPRHVIISFTPNDWAIILMIMVMMMMIMVTIMTAMAVRGLHFNMSCQSWWGSGTPHIHRVLSLSEIRGKEAMWKNPQ
jgi:hypothetical protein